MSLGTKNVYTITTTVDPETGHSRGTPRSCARGVAGQRILHRLHLLH